MLRSIAGSAASLGLLASLSLAAAPHAMAADEFVEATFQRADFEDVRTRLSGECHGAGMAVVESLHQRVSCSVRLTGDEPFLAETGFADTEEPESLEQVVEFNMSRENNDVTVRAQSWIESRDATTSSRQSATAPSPEAHREQLTTRRYLDSLQSMLDELSAEPGTVEDDPDVQVGWEHYFDSEEEWRLEAHRGAVARCEAERLSSAEELEDPRAIESAMEAGTDADPEAVAPIGDAEPGAATPSMSHGGGGGASCEEQQEEVFLWGLARGMDDPTLEEYLAGVPIPRHCPEGVHSDDCR